MGKSGISNPTRIAAIVLNALVVVGILYNAGNDPPVNQRGWVWLAIFVGCPIVNLLGLSRITGRVFTFITAIFNGVIILGWGGLIALMMVWPLGNKPKGIDLLVLLASWLILVLTEIVLVRISTSKASDGSGQREANKANGSV